MLGSAADLVEDHPRVAQARLERADHLADQGLARRDGQRIVMQRDLLTTLRRRELDAVGEKLATETGLPPPRQPRFTQRVKAAVKAAKRGKAA